MIFEKGITLNELLYFKAKLDTLFNNKVDKVTGKSLLSDTEIYRLSSVVNYNDKAVRDAIKALQDNQYNDTAVRALITALDTRIKKLENESVKGVKVNGVKQALSTAKEVDVTVPTKNSQLTNDSGFITAAASNLTNYYTKANTYTKAEVDTKFSGRFKIVTTLPTTNISTATVYLKANSGASGNKYDEYIYISGAWEKIGTKDLDLSGYVKKTDITLATTADIDAMFV